MVDAFLGAGFTYFDTAYGYPGSEDAIKKALVDRHPRDKYTLATKLPAFAANSAEEARGMIETSLKRTGAGYFDFYLLHNIGGARIAKYDDYGMWDYILELKAKGRIRHAGFSFHDNAEVLDRVLTAHPEMEFVQLQINWADWENSGIQSRKCYETARKHGKPVVIMEPVKGGILAKLPEPVEKVLKEENPMESEPSWAIRFAASHEGLITVLSGMSSIEQMKENLATMKHFKPLSASEHEALKKAQKILASYDTVPCTTCRYCADGCPGKVAIPDIFQQMNNHTIFYPGDKARAKGSYGWIRDGLKGPASNCQKCGHCEEVCPQHIKIMSLLDKAVELFEN
jgi:predicted aldo/keto reductase-like oxidoreductase